MVALRNEFPVDFNGNRLALKPTSTKQIRNRTGAVAQFDRFPIEFDLHERSFRPGVKQGQMKLDSRR